MLCVLPEVDVAVVEDVGAHLDVVEALGRQHHAHVIACTATQGWAELNLS